MKMSIRYYSGPIAEPTCPSVFDLQNFPSAGDHRGGDAGHNKWGEGLRAEAERHDHSTCNHW